MSAEDNKTIAHKFIDNFLSARNSHGVDDLLSSNIVSHISGAPGSTHGPEEFRQNSELFFTAFPDLHATIDDVVAEGNKVVARVTARGTNTGPFPGMPMPPTGRKATWSAIAIWQVEDGKVVEHWVQQDMLGIMQQLGVIPAPEQNVG